MHYAPESVTARAVLDSVRLAVVPNVRVLSDPLVVATALLPEDYSVLLGEGSSELAVPNIEALLLQNLGQARVPLELGRSLVSTCQGQKLKFS